MTAPDPRFRDKLAAVLALDFDLGLDTKGAREVARALLPLIAAEVESRVQAAANQRAAEELRAIGRAGLAADPGNHPVRVPVSYLFDRAAALAQPTPATDEEGRA